MENERADLFLDRYKQLEQLLKVHYANESGRYESVVARYENSRECGDMGDELRAVREIRNLLQHSPKIDGSYIVTPSDAVMDSLEKVIRMVEHPRLAVDYGVKEHQVFKTTLNSSLLKVIKVMQDRGFSHVPVIENGLIYGVLSAYTVFEFVAKQGMAILTETTKVKAMREYLPVGKHRNEYYLFMPQTATFVRADEAFQKRDAKGRRLVVIFITEHGQPDEPMIAMLTPWSVVGK